MKNLNEYLKDYVDCIYWIVSEPTDVSVEYHFDRMHELEKELREYVKRNREEESNEI